MSLWDFPQALGHKDTRGGAQSLAMVALAAGKPIADTVGFVPVTLRNGETCAGLDTSITLGGKSSASLPVTLQENAKGLEATKAFHTMWAAKLTEVMLAELNPEASLAEKDKAALARREIARKRANNKSLVKEMKRAIASYYKTRKMLPPQTLVDALRIALFQQNGKTEPPNRKDYQWLHDMWKEAKRMADGDKREEKKFDDASWKKILKKLKRV